MRHIIKLIIYLLFVFYCFGCSRYANQLEYAMRMAGNNRQELEKVLAHYKDDPLKYKATEFLIRNMPGHYSFSDTAYLNSYFSELDSLLNFSITHNSFNDSLMRQIKAKYPKRHLETVSDTRVIKSDFLIDNIDNAFSDWQNGKWATHLDFDEFCEYLLPYKVCETQKLENWRSIFNNFADQSLDKLSYCKLYRNSAWKACEVVNLENSNIFKNTDNSLLEEIILQMGLYNQIPVRDMRVLRKIPYGDCDDNSILATALMRSNGIPTVIDFTPQWTHRNIGHSWCVLLDNSENQNTFDSGWIYPEITYFNYLPKYVIFAKIYRNTYAINNEIIDILNTDKYVPALFRNVYMKDVTRDYMKTVDVKMKVSHAYKSKYAYLSVFDNKDWKPVVWGKKKFGKVTFKDVGKDVIYLPVVMTEHGTIPITDPVMVGRDGKITNIKADIKNKQTMTLYRKYPVQTSLYNIMERFIDGQIQASNHPDFSDYVILHTIKKYGVTSEDVYLENSGAYRYWRYFSPPGSHGNIAELVFYGNDSIAPVIGEIIGNPVTDGKEGIAAVFDGDALTCFNSPDPDNNWVGMDFGKPTAINHIYYLPRSDGNLIETGDQYELFYWADRRWQSLGKQPATCSSLIFEDCPSNGLYLLHNHTKGKEERPFTYENGEQVFY